MEETAPEPSKGYQKKVTKEAPPAAKPKRDPSEYASPTAKKWPAMIEALEAGNVDAVKQMLEEGMNVNVLLAGVSPLMIAASKGHRDVAEVILQAGVNVNERGDDGGTALHVAAAEQAGTDIVELLMEYGVNVEAKNKAGKTALAIAEEKGHREIVRDIKSHLQQLKKDADEWAAFLNSPEGKPFKQSELLEKLDPLFKFWWTPAPALGIVGLLLGLLFHALLLAGAIGLVCGLLAGLSVFLWERSLRRYLERFGPLPPLNIRMVREKRKAGEPILTERGRQAPPAAEEAPDGTGSDSSETVVLGQEIETEADQGEPAERVAPPKPRKTIPYRKIAVIASSVAVLTAVVVALVLYREPLLKLYYAKKLAYKGIEFSERAFLEESSKNNEEAIDLFIRAGMPVDARDEKGQTALMIAAAKGQVNVINRILRQNKGTLNQFDKSGSTALMTAARQGREDVVRVLVEGGADVNFTVPNRDGVATALQAAANVSETSDKQAKVITYLVQKGADVKGKNKAGWFPLLFAAEQGRTDIAGLLIEKGASVNEADSRGVFPLMVAACTGNQGMIALLAEKGAEMKMTATDGQTPLMCAVQNDRKDAVKKLLEKGAAVNAERKGGETALTEATKAGNPDIVTLLLAGGADPSRGYLPEAFLGFKGRPLAIQVKNSRLRDVLQRIAGAAAQDGYVISLDSTGEQKITVKAKLPWNKVLVDLAKKNRLLLVVKDRNVFVTAVRQKVHR